MHGIYSTDGKQSDSWSYRECADMDLSAYLQVFADVGFGGELALGLSV